MLCRACGRMNRDEDLFCGSCGQKLIRAKVCRSCGVKNRHDSVFCGTCGAASSWRAAPQEEAATCRHCGHALNSRDNFCVHCGQQVSAGQLCDRCHTFNREDAQFCAACGAALAIRVAG